MPTTDTWWYTKSRRAQSVDDYETWIQGGVMPTLNAFDNGDIRTTVIIFSHTQGLDAQPSEVASPTLRAGGAGMAISYSPSGFADYSEGVGTLKAGMTNNNSPLAVDIYNHSVSDINQTLRKGNGGPDHTGTIFAYSNVRRLTPVECERLQGFPDDWTAGQSDSARYKQMGNAVAVPVVEWIIQNICDTV